MSKLTDEMLIQLLGKDLYDQLVQKSIAMCGQAYYDVMIFAALGKLVDDGVLKLTVKIPGLG